MDANIKDIVDVAREIGRQETANRCLGDAHGVAAYGAPDIRGDTAKSGCVFSTEN